MNREKGEGGKCGRVCDEGERRPELFSPGQEAGCEYLINSHQGFVEDLLRCAAGHRPPPLPPHKGKPSIQTTATEHGRSGTERPR